MRQPSTSVKGRTDLPAKHLRPTTAQSLKRLRASPHGPGYLELNVPKVGKNVVCTGQLQLHLSLELGEVVVAIDVDVPVWDDSV